MENKISIFLPVRSGSERVKNKNTRKFAIDHSSLLEIKLKQILSIADFFYEIIISTDDPIAINQVHKFKHKKIKIIKRESNLSSSKTKVSKLIEHAKNVTSGEIIFWIHATSPFVDQEDYLKAIKIHNELLKKNTNDSLMSCNRIQQYIWSEKTKDIINKPINMDGEVWINTQELEPLYEINHAFYINSRDNYFKYNNRIGKNPGIYICEGNKKIDIDTPSDFSLAQQIFNNQNKLIS